ncbi:nucleoporin Nup85-like protein [Phycomyces nitens]|nr:nucleoporin Nup85-like protein [Phycomyces nitens]
MPKLSFDAKPENVEKWSAWHRECVKSCHGYFNGPTKDNPLYNLFMILAGDTDTIEAACSFPETMIAVLIYSEPFHLRSDLAPIARRLELPEDVDQVTEVCYYVMGRSWDDVLERCGDSWLETHLGHLLLTAEFLPDGDDGLSSDREQEAITEPIYYVIHDYAENLVSKYQMWREAVDYLSTCRVNREVWIEQLFGNPPLEYKSLDFVKEMLEFSKTNNMNKVQRCLYKAIAGRHEAEGESYEAAVNYARAGDRATLDLLANNILQGYLTNGNKNNTALCVCVSKKEVY